MFLEARRCICRVHFYFLVGTALVREILVSCRLKTAMRGSIAQSERMHGEVPDKVVPVIIVRDDAEHQDEKNYEE